MPFIRHDLAVVTSTAVPSDHAITAVDYCASAIEGAPVKILQAFNFDAINIRVLFLASNTGRSKGSLSTILHDKHCELAIVLGVDEIWRRRNE